MTTLMIDGRSVKVLPDGSVQLPVYDYSHLTLSHELVVAIYRVSCEAAAGPLDGYSVLEDGVVIITTPIDPDYGGVRVSRADLAAMVRDSCEMREFIAEVAEEMADDNDE